MPATTVQYLTLITQICLVVWGIIWSAERYFRGNEKTSSESYIVQQKWNEAASLVLKSLGERVDNAGQTMSDISDDWQKKVGQIDVHVTNTDSRVTVLETQTANVREQISRILLLIDRIEREGCIYGKENRKTLDEIVQRHRNSDIRRS